MAGQTHNKEFQHVIYQIIDNTETVTFCCLMRLHWYQNTIGVMHL